MRTAYVVTHPEATHHVEGLVGGWYDSRLTPAGLAAADAIGARLREAIPRSAAVELYSSDLTRTRQTAQAIGAHLRVEPALDHRLREKSYGEAEGAPQAWLDRRFVPPPATGERMRHDEGIAGAETKRACADRVYAALADITAREAEYQIIVTHGGAATFVIAAWMRLPVEALAYATFRVASGSITRLVEDDFFHNRSLVSLGDTTHLTHLTHLT